MHENDALDRWCWGGSGSKLSNRELFSLAEKLRGRNEISKKDLKKNINDVRSHSRKEIPAHVLQQMNKSFEEQLEKDLLKDDSNSGAPQGRGESVEKSSPGSSLSQSRNAGKHDNNPSVLQKAALRAVKEMGDRLSGKQQKDLIEDLQNISNINMLEKYLHKLLEHEKTHANFADKHVSEDGTGDDKKMGGKDTPGKNGRKKQRTAGPVNGSYVHGETAAEGFKRFIMVRDNAMDSDDSNRPYPDAYRYTSNDCEKTSLTESLVSRIKQYNRIKKKIQNRLIYETSSDELRSLVDKIIELNIVSSTFSDAFLINKDRVTYELAKNAFYRMERMVERKRFLRAGTHLSGSRGIHAVQLDKTQRTSRLTSHIAIFHTLRRGLIRKTMYPYSYLLDEDDLIEYAGRKKVGYSVVFALDISGAVQFGRRIRGVKNACMAFGYYLRRFHPHDKLHYVAYHEKAAEIRFSDVPNLRAINGAGKDIGMCLQTCAEILRRDPERVPIVVLIGDGLPAYGHKAGFYRFMENNKGLLKKAYDSARLMRTRGVNLTFFQFKENRHLWEQYADDTAKKITDEARGMLYRIDETDRIGLSLIENYDNLKKTL